MSRSSSSGARVVELHTRTPLAAPSARAGARPLWPHERDTQRHCEWFRSCRTSATHMVAEDGAEVPICGAHLDVVPTVRRMRAMGVERAARRRTVDDIDQALTATIREAIATYGDTLPVMDIARVIGASRSTVLRWIAQQSKEK